jgi:hypothetical protein
MIGKNNAYALTSKYYLSLQIYDTVDFFEKFDHSSHSKYLFKNINKPS